MSRWLDRALREVRCDPAVPNASKSPKSGTEVAPHGLASHFGDYDHFGTHPSISDWQAHYDECAAIREFDGELPRHEAEVEAYRDTLAALGDDLANAAPRCGARRRDGGSCLAPGMANGRCRFHGGKSTGARSVVGAERARQAVLRHGFYTEAARQERREARSAFLALRKALAALR